jgi:hypothetical protein
MEKEIARNEEEEAKFEKGIVARIKYAKMWHEDRVKQIALKCIPLEI